MPIRTARAGKPTGVWELQALQAAVDSGEVSPTDLVWTAGFQDWKPLSVVADEIGISLAADDEESPPPIPIANPKISPPQHANTEAADYSGVTFRSQRPVARPSKSHGFSRLLKICFLCLVGFFGLLFIYAKVQPILSGAGGTATATSTPKTKDGEQTSASARSDTGEFCGGAYKHYPIVLETDRTGASPAINTLVRNGQYAVMSSGLVNTSKGPYCESRIKVSGMVSGTTYEGEYILVTSTQ